MDDNHTLGAQEREGAIQAIARALHQARRTQNVSLQRVSQATKIRVQILEALEEGRWMELPDEVYRINFIRKFASFLRLNPEELLAPYLMASQVTQPELGKLEPREELSGAGGRRVWIVAGVALFVTIGVMKLIQYDLQKPTAIPVVPAVAPELMAPPAAPPAPATPASTHELAVYSINPLWLRVNADDRAFEGFIPQGTTWTWSGMGDFQVRLGHTKQVVVAFNGQPVPLRENQRRLFLPAPEDIR